jgi:hypothetical protein
MFEKFNSYLTEKEKRKALEIERSMVIDTREHEIRLKRLDIEEKIIESGKDIGSDESLDRTAMEQMDKSWKDEFILVILFSPLIVSFIPRIQEIAVTGFEIMKGIPDWYVGLLVGITIVTYGLRGLVRFMASHSLINSPK